MAAIGARSVKIITARTAGTPQFRIPAKLTISSSEIHSQARTSAAAPLHGRDCIYNRLYWNTPETLYLK